MREKIKEFLDVRKNIKSSKLRVIGGFLQIFSIVLAYPIYNALEKREFFWIFNMDILRFLGSRASVAIIMIVILGIGFWIIYPLFVLFDKHSRKRKRR